MKKNIIIIGAGPAGLATAYHLQKIGVDFIILEKGDQSGFSYSKMHDSLKLLTPAIYSNLPGMRLSKNPFKYYSKKELVNYYHQYQKHFQFPLQLNTEVRQIEKVEGEFKVKTNQGDFEARKIIIATGLFSHPFIPKILGLKGASIPITHSSEYRSPKKWKQKIKEKGKILVVGAGNTGVEIATELAEAGYKVTLSSQRRPKILPHKILGIDIHFFSRPFELFSRLLVRLFHRPLGVHRTPVLGRKVIKDIQLKKIHLTSALKEIKGNMAKFKEEILPFDAIIFATGYRYQPPFLKDFTADPNILYVGKPGHYGIDSNYLRGINLDAKRVVKQLCRI